MLLQRWFGWVSIAEISAPSSKLVMTVPYLTKSRYLAGQRCCRRLWRLVHEAAKRGRPVLAPLDEAPRTLIARAEYEDRPHGRGVYVSAARSFVVDADRQIFPHAALVRAHFSLPPGVPFRTDPHYRNSKRLLREQSAV